MIGYYVHHQGRGHLHRAVVLAGAAAASGAGPVTGLSTLPAPPAWPGAWLRLPADDGDAGGGSPPVDTTAGGRLHWVPRHHPGVRSRANAISSWIEEARPRLLVVDVSVETLLLARLHGVPVVSTVLPGRRTDAAHRLGFDVADALVAAWPSSALGMSPGLRAVDRARLTCIGGVSRFEVAPPTAALATPGRSRHAVVLQGRGGAGLTARPAEALEASTPGWRWTVLGGPGAWTSDRQALRAVLESADVVVAQPGQNAIADLAALRRPAVVVPGHRPFAEQETTAAVLERGRWPALARGTFEECLRPELLEEAASLDGQDWAPWVDGQAPARFASLVAEMLSTSGAA